MANLCVNRLFIAGASEQVEAALADLDRSGEREGLSFAALLPEPEALTEGVGAGLDSRKAAWRREHWGSTSDPLSAERRGQPSQGGIDVEFQTDGPPLPWAEALARAHPLLEVRLLYDCADDQRAGMATFSAGRFVGYSEVVPAGYERWLEEMAPRSIYGLHEPPYETVFLTDR